MRHPSDAEVPAPADARGAHAERRRYYGLTMDGERVLRADARRLEGVVRQLHEGLGRDTAAR